MESIAGTFGARFWIGASLWEKLTQVLCVSRENCAAFKPSPLVHRWQLVGCLSVNILPGVC